MSNSQLDELKNKAAELDEKVKHSAQEAKLQGEKALDDLKHTAKEAKLNAEAKLDDLKHEAKARHAEDKAALQEKADDLERVKRYAGAEQIDTIIRKVKEQERTEQQIRRYDKSYGTR